MQQLIPETSVAGKGPPNPRQGRNGTVGKMEGTQNVEESAMYARCGPSPSGLAGLWAQSGACVARGNIGAGMTVADGGRGRNGCVLESTQYPHSKDGHWNPTASSYDCPGDGGGGGKS